MAKSIVLIEDDREMSELIGMYFERGGLKVYRAEDGRSGLKLVKKRLPNAIVLDIKLPKMNGYEVCAALQGDETMGKIPIVIITGLTENNRPEEDAQWRDRMQVADFISKPFDPQDLAQRVVKLIGAE